MYVRDFDGNEELLVDFVNDSVRISRNLQGKYELSLTLIKTDKNLIAYNMVQDLSSIIVQGEVFTVRILNEDAYTKNVTCTHEFFDLIDEYIENTIPEGTRSIEQALNLIRSRVSDWTFEVQGSIDNVFLPELGNNNVISLLNDITTNFLCEYTVSSVDKKVIIATQIGEETDYQIRYGHNLSVISKSVDASNVKTRIKVRYNPDGDGNYRNEVTYISPNESNYPRPKTAATVEIDTTSQAIALAYGSSQITDTPSISILVEFSELKRNGYGSEEIKLGNSFYLIDQRLNEEDLARIVEIVTFPYTDKNPVLTVANRVKYYTDITIEQQRRQLLNQQKQQELEQKAVIKGDEYDGVVITTENGLEVNAQSYRNVVIKINAQEGFSITNGLIRKFYVDTQGNVVFDGSLRVTDGTGVYTVLEAFKNSRGGLVRIYDNSGRLNAEIGSETSGGASGGGVLNLLSDSGAASAILSSNAQNSFSSPEGTLRLNGSANVTLSSGASGFLIISDGLDTAEVSSLGFFFNGEELATQKWVRDNFQPL